ncbi:ATP-grasp domain-containing protein [Blastopirellula marina]|nr:ATP-grasp domain-containing protein [Blastopirellula marina]
MDGKRIGLIGASCRAMAASLVAGGTSVAVADMFADFDTCRIAEATPLKRYPWSAPAWLGKASVDAWCYTGGLENYPRLISRMSRACPLLGNQAETLRQVRDPFRLAEWARKHDFQFPEVARDASSDSSGRWLLKPLRSAGGLNIQHSTSADFSSCRFYRQRFADGVPMSISVLSTPDQWQLVGACQLHVGSDWGTPTEFLFAGATTLPLARLEALPELEAIVAALHQESGLLGLWGIDVVMADGPIVLEVNPRWTATMPLYERNLATRLMPRHIAACGDATFDRLPTSANGTSGLRILYAQRPVRCTAEHLTELSARFDLSTEASLAQPSIADIPNVGTEIEVGHPICSLYADGADEAEVERSLADQVTAVQRILQ